MRSLNRVLLHLLSSSVPAAPLVVFFYLDNFAVTPAKPNVLLRLLNKTQTESAEVSPGELVPSTSYQQMRVVSAKMM